MHVASRRVRRSIQCWLSRAEYLKRSRELLPSGTSVISIPCPLRARTTRTQRGARSRSAAEIVHGVQSKANAIIASDQREQTVRREILLRDMRQNETIQWQAGSGCCSGARSDALVQRLLCGGWQPGTSAISSFPARFARRSSGARLVSISAITAGRDLWDLARHIYVAVWDARTVRLNSKLFEIIEGFETGIYFDGQEISAASDARQS